MILILQMILPCITVVVIIRKKIVSSSSTLDTVAAIPTESSWFSQLLTSDLLMSIIVLWSRFYMFLQLYQKLDLFCQYNLTFCHTKRKCESCLIGSRFSLPLQNWIEKRVGIKLAFLRVLIWSSEATAVPNCGLIFTCLPLTSVSWFAFLVIELIRTVDRVDARVSNCDKTVSQENFSLLGMVTSCESKKIWTC